MGQGRKPDVRELDCLAGIALAGLLLAFAFIWLVMTVTTPEQRMNLYDAIGESTHIRWR